MEVVCLLGTDTLGVCTYKFNGRTWQEEASFELGTLEDIDFARPLLDNGKLILNLSKSIRGSAPTLVEVIVYERVQERWQEQTRLGRSVIPFPFLSMAADKGRIAIARDSDQKDKVVIYE